MPESKPDQRDAEIVSTLSDAAEGPRPPIMSMKPRLDILLVDDDHNDCALFGIAIAEMDVNIWLQTVTNGEQAIDYLEGRGVYAERAMHPLPSLVVLDLDMPLSGGLEFLDWRRTSGSFSTLPVVILSGFAYKGAIDTALAMGANTFISKPFGFEGWKVVVRQIRDFAVECPPPTAAATV